jgi:hypothetical protein
MRITAVLVVALALATVLSAQDTLPNNFAAAGLGFQSTANPQTSGWASMCHRNEDANLFGWKLPSYLCGATDYSGTVTSARVELSTVLFANRLVAFGPKVGGGAAYNANGMGGAFAGGGWVSLNAENFVKISGVWLTASVTWSKDDVSVAQAAGKVPVVLQQLAARGVYRFGIGKAW